jgi:hypothetical protein
MLPGAARQLQPASLFCVLKRYSKPAHAAPDLLRALRLRLAIQPASRQIQLFRMMQCRHDRRVKARQARQARFSWRARRALLRKTS